MSRETSAAGAGAKPARTVDDSGRSQPAAGHEKRHLLRQNSINLPEPGPLVHSYSQPELYYQSVSPARSALADEMPLPAERLHEHHHHHHHHHYSQTTRSGDDTDTSFLFSTSNELDHSHDGHHHQDTSLGPSTYQFSPERGDITTSPTMEQHAETHQTWIEELREEQRREAEVQDAIAAQEAENTTDLDETAPLTPLTRRSSSSPEQLKKAVPRIRSATDDDVSDSSSDSDELPELSVLEVIALCLPAAAVMIGWAVGEALLLPYLLSLGVAPTIANFAFLSVELSELCAVIFCHQKSMLI
jgi:hypothetical protein